MPAFLEKLTKHIYAAHKDRLGDICIVLPNRRASLFIRKQLGEILENTSFLPGFYSIEDFVTEVSGLVPADKLGLQFSLYDIHRGIEGEQGRSFEEFLPYAAWMLSDFNEIDMYLVDQDQLFSYLSDAKAMALWNPDGRPLSEFEKRYLEFFRSLQKYYRGLNELLKSENQAYQGMAFRQLAENIVQATDKMKWKKVVFAGFNALTPSEEEIITHLLNTGQGEIYWDADKYYTENKKQEAGKFLRGYFKSLNRGDVLWEEDNFSEDKNIEIIGIPKNAGQVKYAGEILQQFIKKKGNLDKTALVLPDEGLLIPLLNSIPEEAGKFNVTMGLALRNTPLFTLLDSILSMHQNAERFARLKGGKEKVYYSKDLLKIFNHPWMRMLDDHGGDGDSISAKIRGSNRIFFTPEGILEYLHEEHRLRKDASLLFPEKPGAKAILKSFFALIASLRALMIDERKAKALDLTIELEYLFRFSTLLQRLQDLLEQHQSISTIKTLQLIFRQLAGQQRIPFYGEPLQGLQIMGVLETRTLDFDTLIMLSVNEGTLPASRMINSFIPHDIKKEFNLPTYRHNNAVFAYHFYRLIQRAKDVYLLYNTESGQLGSEEKSRFITQLLHEVRKYNPGIHIRERLLSMPPIPGVRDTDISISKDQDVMALLKKEALRGFHPSSLNLYINCPLQFYLARLLNIREADEIEETIDNRVLGIVIHEALNELFRDHLHTVLDKNILLELKKQVTAEVEKQFQKYMHDGDLSHGKNHLILNVAEKMLKQLLNKEISWLEDGLDLKFDSLERKYTSSLHVRNGKMDEEVIFSGTIDRVDTKGGAVRILDYKTGFVNDRQLNPKNWEKLFSDPDFSKAFQLMMYSWLYHKENLLLESMQAGIISLRMPGKGPVLIKPPEGKVMNIALMDEFEEHLQKLMTEIFDPAIPFRQTEKEERCKYCNFKEICNRMVSVDNY